MNRQTDVHTEHCCKIHGCKYGDKDCTVVNELKIQSFPCESCDFALRHLLASLQEISSVLEICDIELKVKND